MPGMYNGYKTGSGGVIPTTTSGAVDVNALIGQMVDRGVWTYYYTLNIPVATQVASNYQLFNAAINQADPYNAGVVLSGVQTNMPNTSTNGFNAPRDLLLDSIGFSFVNTQLADQVAFEQNCWTQFRIIDKVFFEGPLSLFPPGAGFSGYSTKTGESYWNLGIPNPQARNRFNMFGKYIAPNMNWSLIIYFPNSTNQFTTLPATPAAGTGPIAGTGVGLRVFLNGLTDRAVQ